VEGMTTLLEKYNSKEKRKQARKENGFFGVKQQVLKIIIFF
jgi:hypothetical protein